MENEKVTTPHESKLMKALMDQFTANMNVDTGQFTLPSTDEGRYAVGVFEAATEVLNVCDQLEYAINKLRSPRLTDGELVEEIAYEIENFLLRVAMIVDRCLKLINVVYDLGIPSRECSLRTVADNSHVDKEVADSIRQLDKITQEFRVRRNEIVHKQTYSDPSLIFVSMVDVIHRSSKGQDELLGEINKPIRTHASKFLDEKCGDFDAVRKRVSAQTVDFLDQLADAYQVKFDCRME